jgi:hypothetical protein
MSGRSAASRRRLSPQAQGEHGLVFGHAEVALQALQVVFVEAERGLAMHEQRVLGDGRGHGGVAVAVAAHPGAEAQERGHFERLSRVRALQRLLEVGVDAGHHLPEGMLEVVEAVVDLVEHGGRAAVHFFAQPEGGDLLADAVLHVRALARGQALVFEDLGEAGQAAQLVQDGAPPRFGRMGGEHGLHEQAAQPVLQDVRRHLRLRGQGHRLRDRLLVGADGGLHLALALAQHAQAVVLLRHVHEVEIRRERADDEARLVQAQSFRAVQEGLALRAEVARPAALGPQGLGLGPVFLHEGEAGLAFLLAQDLAEHAAQRVDVAAEGVLVVIAGTGGRFHGDDCMPRIDGRRACLYAGVT